MLMQIYFSHLIKMEGHSRKPFKRSRLDVRKYVFSDRIVDKWNSLPDHCININTVNSFKSCISKHMEPETGKF